jgi:DNA-binding GntR family transcriptional regulator
MKSLNAETTIVRNLRSAIARGTLKPGIPLLQDELAERFKVSRVPVRDALKALEADGLITFLANRTAIVTVLSAEDIEEIFNIRRMLECDLICRATMLATSLDQRSVQKSLSLLDTATSGAQFAKLDREFHAAMYQPAKQPRQQVIVDKLGQQLARFYGSTLDFCSYHQDCQGSHHEIADAFLRRDGDRAATCLDRHLALAKQKILVLVSINKE